MLSNFDKYFRFLSYSLVFSGVLALVISGGAGYAAAFLFLIVFIGAWLIEDTKWQISERLALVLIFGSIPIFFLEWKYHLLGGGRDQLAVSALAGLILVLGGIKLLQKKSDRDWIFLYVISFFQVLLAAGVSISPSYLATLLLFLIISILAIISFEIKKTAKEVEIKKKADPANTLLLPGSKRRLSLISSALLVMIILSAIPTFFFLPRFGGAGMGSNFGNSRNMTGFSDSVRLGEIGAVQQSDEIVMRALIEGDEGREIENFRWRGVALDRFDNKRWSRSGFAVRPFNKTEGGNFLLGEDRAGASISQTIYLESLDTPVLFALSRPVRIQANFQMLIKDEEDSITMSRGDGERTSYRVFSDTAQPKAEVLRKDPGLQSGFDPEYGKYLQLPEIDPAIKALADNIIRDSKAPNNFDKAKALESYLQNNFGYTLDLKVGGEEPLADFLFNKKEGHCEYFATALAVMLRSEGIPSRIVNGFQHGEYNETAGVYVVRQRDAHSWVEAYFPASNSWITLDPTPFAGRPSGIAEKGFSANIAKYFEALETFWIQYFVSYDNNEQKSLTKSLKSTFIKYQTSFTEWTINAQNYVVEWWSEVSGAKGFEARIYAVAYGLGFLLLSILSIFLSIGLFRMILRLKIWKRLISLFGKDKERSLIEFYERMIRALENKGMRRADHQTPLEFAMALNIPEVIRITESYHRVRFGEYRLAREEAKEIEDFLAELEGKKGRKAS